MDNHIQMEFYDGVVGDKTVNLLGYPVDILGVFVFWVVAQRRSFKVIFSWEANSVKYSVGIRFSNYLLKYY